MTHQPTPTLEVPSDSALAQAMLDRCLERRRVRLVAAQLMPRVELALGVRRRGTS